ncbi:hypothetical protein Pan189_04460 [Stratiformator vulcanicus]|uniref:Uncharacterized protein n=1 Tax=Stratiformator vulcanicus TaxID=2527980 RepID=A0A517QWT1_9PLAN|nr:hypothetical protein Pan189_04460 [Stratiformator vulcanicus]
MSFADKCREIKRKKTPAVERVLLILRYYVRFSDEPHLVIGPISLFFDFVASFFRGIGGVI